MIAKNIKSVGDRTVLCDTDRGVVIARCENIFRNRYSRPYRSEHNALAAMWSDEVEWIDVERPK